MATPDHRITPDKLPADILAAIFLHLDCPDGFSRTCKRFLAVSADSWNRKRYLIRRHPLTQVAHAIFFRYPGLLLKSCPGNAQDMIDWIIGTDSSSTLHIPPPSRFTLQSAFRGVAISHFRLYTSPFRIPFFSALRLRHPPTRVNAELLSMELYHVVQRIANSIYGADNAALFGDDLEELCNLLNLSTPYEYGDGHRIRLNEHREPDWVVLEEPDPEHHTLDVLRTLVTQFRFAPSPMGVAAPKVALEILWHVAKLPDPSILTSLLENWPVTPADATHTLTEGYTHIFMFTSTNFDRLASRLLDVLPVDAATFHAAFAALVSRARSFLIPNADASPPNADTLFASLHHLVAHAARCDLTLRTLALTYIKSREFAGETVSQVLDLLIRWDKEDLGGDDDSAVLARGHVAAVTEDVMDELARACAGGDVEMISKACAYPHRLLITNLHPTHPVLRLSLSFLLRTATMCCSYSSLHTPPLRPLPPASITPSRSRLNPVRRATPSVYVSGDTLAGAVYSYARGNVYPRVNDVAGLGSAIVEAKREQEAFQERQGREQEQEQAAAMEYSLPGFVTTPLFLSVAMKVQTAVAYVISKKPLNPRNQVDPEVVDLWVNDLFD
ncbi:hypothetical protein M427DRAFT_26972 [Gonapodya prolifera JEL478]|uniref:F-box domain-containing protein n=1 Tax=Gonapodya prolifera (strain JEL478) TaxID=1344416 RepID=A0A139B0E3_GONPJ|nr:hypothetical protein M427DRAFT_26972 [Gonapodya prolifera JEL478]|eukprot:KXS22410.1 hypothetical protein M427DRAFT_26972 [Gonapodya prolifera JEL478]